MLLNSGSPSVTLDGKTYILNDHFEWGDGKGTFLVPKSFKTDLATIPACFDFVFLKHRDLIDTAAVLHDQGCLGYQFHRGVRRRVSRRFNDRLFFRCMVDIGVPKVIAFNCYLAVRFWSLTHNWLDRSKKDPRSVYPLQN